MPIRNDVECGSSDMTDLSLNVVNRQRLRVSRLELVLVFRRGKDARDWQGQ